MSEGEGVYWRRMAGRQYMFCTAYACSFCSDDIAYLLKSLQKYSGGRRGARTAFAREIGQEKGTAWAGANCDASEHAKKSICLHLNAHVDK